MFIPIDHIAEMLDVDVTTVWRWARSAGIRPKTRKRGRGGQLIPARALMNYLAKSGKIPFSQIERDSLEDKSVPQVLDSPK